MTAPDRDGSDRRTLAERLAGDIAEAILGGALEPGARLDEQGLADRFRVSRTPVREALRQLATSGLIEVRPRRGATVAAVTVQSLEHMFVAMAEIEATAARLAALGMTPIERRRLGVLHDAMAEPVAAGDQDAYAEANVRFHTAIYAGTHNPVIADFATALRRRLAPFRRAQFRVPGRLAGSHGEHAVVVRAIVAGDAVAAHAAMLHHVSLVEDAFEQIAGTRTRA